MEIWLQPRSREPYVLFRTDPIAALSGTPGPKLAEGDQQVPEGFYDVGPQAMKPDSAFHLAFNLGYPNAFDRSLQRTGSFIMVHGGDQSIGCLAMTDARIEEIYTLAAAALQKGQTRFQVQIYPFRMSPDRLDRESSSPWVDFWRNLAEGDALFARHHLPPTVQVQNQRYHFSL